jgi:hypothetical protein
MFRLTLRKPGSDDVVIDLDGDFTLYVEANHGDRMVDVGQVDGEIMGRELHTIYRQNDIRFLDGMDVYADGDIVTIYTEIGE